MSLGNEKQSGACILLVLILITVIPNFLWAQTEPGLYIQSGASVIVDGDGTELTNLDVDGDVVIDGTLDLNSDAFVYLTGDFIRNNNGFQEGQSTLVFNGSAAQSISGTSSGTYQETFYNLYIDNSAGVSIDDSKVGLLSVKNVLTPNQGVFTTNDLLRLRATSTLYGRVAYGAGSVTGDVLFQKYLYNTGADWRQLSMPVSGAWDDANWTGMTFNFSNHTPSEEINTYNWSSANSGGGDYAGGWVQSTSTVNGAVGLSVFLDASTPAFAVSQTISCQGTLNNIASSAYSLQFTRDPADNPITPGVNPASKGWNFIPNRYPALIDVEAWLTSVSSKAFEPSYKAVHVYNSVVGQYQPILLDNSVTKVDWNTGGASIENAEANIPPFQAFWVKANTTGQTVTLYRDEMQTTEFKDFDNEKFMKKKPELFRLNVFDEDSMWDQVVVYFKQNSTRKFDDVGDAYYLASPKKEAPIFYAIEDKNPTCIVARPKLLADSVELNFMTTKENSSFSIYPQLQELDRGLHVYLKDRSNNTVYELKDLESKKFFHSSPLAQPRFVVYFSENKYAFDYLVTRDPAELNVFSSNGVLTIRSTGLEGNFKLDVIDLSGRKLIGTQVYLNDDSEIELEVQSNANVFMVRVYGGHQYIAKKVFVN